MFGSGSKDEACNNIAVLPAAAANTKSYLNLLNKGYGAYFSQFKIGKDEYEFVSVEDANGRPAAGFVLFGYNKGILTLADFVNSAKTHELDLHGSENPERFLGNFFAAASVAEKKNVTARFKKELAESFVWLAKPLYELAENEKEFSSALQNLKRCSSFERVGFWDYVFGSRKGVAVAYDGLFSYEMLKNAYSVLNPASRSFEKDLYKTIETGLEEIISEERKEFAKAQEELSRQPLYARILRALPKVAGIAVMAGAAGVGMMAGKDGGKAVASKESSTTIDDASDILISPSPGASTYYPDMSLDGKIIYVNVNDSGSGTLIVAKYNESTHKIDFTQTLSNTTHGKGLGTPKWSPNGSYIAYISSAADDPEVKIITKDGTFVAGPPQQSQDQYYLSWCDDDSVIYVGWTLEGLKQYITGFIFLNGGENTLINSEIKTISSPICTFDNKVIATNNYAANNTSVLVSMNKDGTNTENLVVKAQGRYSHSIDQNPNSSLLAYSYILDRGPGDTTEVYNRHTKEITQLSTEAAKYVEFSPDGQKIAFYGYNSNSIKVVDILTKVTTTVVNVTGVRASGMISWTPDSKHIIFDANGDIRITKEGAIPESTNQTQNNLTQPPQTNNLEKIINVHGDSNYVRGLYEDYLLLFERYNTEQPNGKYSAGYIVNIRNRTKELFFDEMPDSIYDNKIVYEEEGPYPIFGYWWDKQDIFLYDINTKEKIPLTENNFPENNPDIFNDLVVYEYVKQPQDNECYGINTINIKTKEVKQITPATQIHKSPHFVGNGSAIVYTQYPACSLDVPPRIVKRDLSSQAQTTLLNSDDSGWVSVVFARDDKIIFSRHLDNEANYFIYNLTTKETKEIAYPATFYKEKFAFVKDGAIWLSDLGQLLNISAPQQQNATPPSQQTPIVNPATPLEEKIKSYLPTILHDSRPDTAEVALYTPYNPQADDSDIRNNHENFDAGEFPKENVVHAAVKETQDFDYYEYVYERANNPHMAGITWPFAHEHDVNLAIVKVDKWTGQPVALAVRYHELGWSVKQVSRIDELRVYSEWGSHEYAVAPLPTADGKGLALTKSNTKIVRLEERISDMDIDSNGYLITDEPHPSIKGVKAPWLLGELKDPETLVFRKYQQQGWEKSVMLFELHSPATLEVMIGDKKTSSEMAGIANSGYDNNTIAIIGANATAKPKVIVRGTGNGTIHLNGYNINGEAALPKFQMTAPIRNGQVYEVTPDWQAISQSKGESVTVRVDKDGDGVFEKTIYQDSQITSEELTQDKPQANISFAGIPLIGWLAAGAAAIGAAGASIYHMLGRKGGGQKQSAKEDDSPQVPVETAPIAETNNTGPAKVKKRLKEKALPELEREEF